MWEYCLQSGRMYFPTRYNSTVFSVFAYMCNTVEPLLTDTPICELNDSLAARVSCRGGGPLDFPPRNLEIEYGYYCGAINISYLILHVTGHKYVSSKCCLESMSQITSEAIWEDLNSTFSYGGGEACPQTPLVGTHAYARMSVLLHATIILLPSPQQLKILYETLIRIYKTCVYVYVTRCVNVLIDIDTTIRPLLEIEKQDW